MSIPLNKPGFELMIDLINLSNNTKFTPADLTVTEIQPLDDPLYPNYNTTAVARGTGTTTFKGPKPVRFRRLDLEVLTGGRSRHFDFPERETPYTMEEVLVSVNNRFNIQLVAGVDVDDVPVPVGANAALPLTVLPDSYVYNGGVTVTVNSEEAPETGWQFINVGGDSAVVANRYLVSTGWGRSYGIRDSQAMDPSEYVNSFPVESDMWSLSYAGGRYGLVAGGYDSNTSSCIIATYPLATLLNVDDHSDFHRAVVDIPGYAINAQFEVAAHPILDLVFLMSAGDAANPGRIYTRSFSNPSEPWSLYLDMGDIYTYGQTKDQDWISAVAMVREFYTDLMTGALYMNISFDGEDGGVSIYEIETIDPNATGAEFTLKPAAPKRLLTAPDNRLHYAVLVPDPTTGGKFVTSTREYAKMPILSDVDVLLETNMPPCTGGAGLPSAAFQGTPAEYQAYLAQLMSVIAPEPNCTGGADGGILEQPIVLYTAEGAVESGATVLGGYYVDPRIFPEHHVIYGRYNEVCNPN